MTDTTDTQGEETPSTQVELQGFARIASLEEAMRNTGLKADDYEGLTHLHDNQRKALIDWYNTILNDPELLLDAKAHYAWSHRIAMNNEILEEAMAEVGLDPSDLEVLVHIDHHQSDALVAAFTAILKDPQRTAEAIQHHEWRIRMKSENVQPTTEVAIAS